MHNKFRRKLLELLSVSLLIGGRCAAQFEEGISNVECGVIACSGTIPSSPNVVTWTSQGETYPTIRNIVRLKINELAATGTTGSPMEYFPTPFTATATVFVELWSYNATLSSPATDTETVVLTVNYNPAPGQKYTPINYILAGKGTGSGAFVQSRVTLKQVNVTGLTGSRWTATNVDSMLTVENEMQILRYFTLSDSLTRLTPSFFSVDSVDYSDQVPASWTFPDSAGNNFSQLEYAWVENETQSYYSVGGSFSTASLFQQNSTRIDINDSCGIFKYNIPLLYDANPATGGGVLYFRARAVDRKNDGSMIVGPWSTPYGVTRHQGHEDSLNWQVTTDFAEDERSKTVIQYYDGTLRPRQTVTRDNSTGNITVAETIYDLQGRPNVQIPAYAHGGQPDPVLP